MQAREVIGRTPDSSYFSLSDWKGCTVTRYETTAYEYVGERERERGLRQHQDPLFVQQHPSGFFIVYSIKFSTRMKITLSESVLFYMAKDNVESMNKNFPL